MNRLLFILLFVAGTLQAQVPPYVRNWADTNPSPFAIRGIHAGGATTSAYPWVVTIPSSGGSSNDVWVTSNALWTAGNAISNAGWQYTTAVSNQAWIGSNVLNGYIGAVSNNVVVTSNSLSSSLTASNDLWVYTTAVSNLTWAASNSLTGTDILLSNYNAYASNFLYVYSTGISNLVLTTSNALVSSSTVTNNQFTTNIVGTPIAGTVIFDQSYHSNAYRYSTNTVFADTELVTEERVQLIVNGLRGQLYHLWTNINPVITSNFSLGMTELSDQWLTNALSAGSNHVGYFYFTNGVGQTFLPAGAYSIHVHTVKNNTQPATIGWDLMVWRAGVNVIVQAGESGSVPETESGMDLGNTLSTNFPILTTDLIGVHLWEDRSGGAVTVRIHLDGDTECHLATPAIASTSDFAVLANTQTFTGSNTFSGGGFAAKGWGYSTNTITTGNNTLTMDMLQPFALVSTNIATASLLLANVPASGTLISTLYITNSANQLLTITTPAGMNVWTNGVKCQGPIYVSNMLFGILSVECYGPGSTNGVWVE